MKTFLKILTFTALSFFSMDLYSQTEIAGGEVSGVWTKANSPYNINGDITIPDGKTLEIKPGTTISFNGYYKILVNGRLVARGTKVDSILFTKSATTSSWHGIRFEHPSGTDSSFIDYCVIEYGEAKGEWPENCGGAIYAGGLTKIQITNSTFFQNQATDRGGAIYVTDDIPVLIKNNTIIKNNASLGSAIYAYHSSPDIFDNIISNNNASWGTIDLVHTSRSSRIIGNTIVNNKANGGAAIHFDHGSCPQLFNNTIANNYSEQYGGAFTFVLSSPFIQNTIIYGNRSLKGNQVFLRDNISRPYFINCNIEGGTELFEYCNIKGNIESFECEGSWNKYPVDKFTNNIDSNPDFSNPTNDAGTDFEGYKANWSLKVTSPCINAGSQAYKDIYLPDFDYAGNPRFSDGNIDIGAFEYQNASDSLKSDFKASVTVSDAIPQLVQFTDLSSGLPTGWKWDFGDSETSSDRNPEHTYQNNGTFSVSLTIRKGDKVNTKNKLQYLSFDTEFINGQINGILDKKHYTVTGDIIVPSGKTLEIKDGTTISFSGYYKLLVNGRLLARGTNTDSIIFTSCDANTYWKGIRFENISGNADSSYIDHCIIEHGEATGAWPENCGGAIFSEGRATKLQITNSRISRNKAQYGGAVYLWETPALIKNNLIIMNWANDVGVIFAGNSSPNIINNMISNNFSRSGIIYLDHNDNSRIIGNIVVNNTSSTAGSSFNFNHDISTILINNTIANNFARNYALIFYNSSPKIYNTIIYGNPAGEVLHLSDTSSNPSFINCNIEGGIGSFGGDGAGINYPEDIYTKNIDKDPIFTYPSNDVGDNFTGYNVNWSLKVSSPCINSGNLDTSGLNLPSTDFLGNPRIASGLIDIGAIEYQPEYDLSPITWLSKTSSCKFTDKETITIRIKNYGSRPVPGFTIYYSVNGGVSYVAEDFTDTINPLSSIDFTFNEPANFATSRTYSCQIIVKSPGDYIASNDTFITEVVSYKLSTGLKSVYNFCEGTSDTIQVNPGMTSYQWTGGISSSNYLAVNKSGTYSVKVINNEGCVAEENTIVTFHLPPASPSGTDKLTCEGVQAASLTAIGTNIKWYNDSKLNKLIAQGNSYSPNINKQGIYPFYITQTEPVYDCTSPASTIKLTINPQPSPPIADDVYIGLGDAAKSFTAAGTDIQWYSKPDGTGLLYNGNTYNPNKTDLGTYEYYVTQTVDNCESQPKKISLYILDIPSPPKTSDKIICRGRGDSKLQAEGVNVNWYSDKDLKNLVGSGSEFDTGEVNAGEYIYYVTQTVNNVISATGTVKLTIIDVPYAPEAENVTIFKGEDPRPLTATGQSIKWYTDEALTNKVFEGTEFSTGKTDAGTYTYYVTQTVNGCESPTRLVEYTLTETLNQIFTTLCEGDESIIEAPGQNVKWYADETKATLLSGGNKFSTGKTTPGDYTFYYTQTVNNTESKPAKAVLTIHPLPAKPEIMETGSSFCYEDIVKCTNYDKQYSYNWYLDETPIAGETGSEYELKKDLRGILKLVVTDLNTKCLNSSKDYMVSSFIPEIVLKGDNILICKNLTNDYKAWQWFRDNQKIENATYQFYEAKQPGEYFTEATNTIDCVMKSNKISTLQTFTVNLYPTINNGNFNLEIQNAKAEQVNLKVYNIFGLKVNEMEIEMMAEKTVMPVTIKGIQPGIYMLELTFGNNRFMRRMVVE